ncbi:methyltransferase domain-containing protein [Thermodesulfobacteriota bacterium]
MAEFKETRWADREFSKLYRDAADIYMPFRQRFIEVTKSLYSFFFDNQTNVRVLDLGCGDGFFIEELLKIHTPESITLVDGSADMLNAAKKRMNGRADVEYIQASFQDIINTQILKGQYDFIYSSFAIHHLVYSEKERLYFKLYNHLNPGGCFIHNDVIAPSSGRIEKWYLTLWREWIEEFPDREKSAGMEIIPEKYKESPDDFPDPLDTHLELLKKARFIDVDCFFKYGIFALFGGFKAE